MYAWLVSKFGGLGLKLAAIGAAIGGIFLFWQSAKRTGRIEQREEQAEDKIAVAHEQAAEEIQQARDAAAVVTSTSKATSDVQAEIVRTDSATVDERLRDEWTRD